MSFATIEQCNTPTSTNYALFLSPEPQDTGSKLMAAIERTLHETIEVPETNKSEGSYWRQDDLDKDLEREGVVRLETKCLEVPEGPAMAHPLTPTTSESA